MRGVTTDTRAASRDSDRAAPDEQSLAGFRRYTYWSLVGTAVGVMVLFVTSGTVAWPPDPLGVGMLLGLPLVVVAVIRLAAQHIPTDPHAAADPAAIRRWAVVGAVGSVPLAAGHLTAGDAMQWAFAPAVIASLVIAGLPRQARTAAGLAAVGVAGAVGFGASLVLPVVSALAAWLGVMSTGLVLFITLASVWTWDIVVQLDRARRHAAALAVANERLRFAADLHDIQGHHLQVIALKSELAARLAPREPDRAAAEMTAVQQLAADAMRDTRAVVHGYRRTTLEAEIANATAVLGSAGIDARLEVDRGLSGDGLPSAHRHVLGLVLREAVTNVLRHSDALRAQIRLHADGSVQLEIANDGAPPGPGGDSGGLAGLADRLEQVGGTLRWGREGERFVVRAALPLGDGAR